MHLEEFVRFWCGFRAVFLLFWCGVCAIFVLYSKIQIDVETTALFSSLGALEIPNLTVKFLKVWLFYNFTASGWPSLRQARSIGESTVRYSNLIWEGLCWRTHAVSGWNWFGELRVSFVWIVAFNSPGWSNVVPLSCFVSRIQCIYSRCVFGM